MNKISILGTSLALLVSGCHLTEQQPEEKFVNPVFYEKMISASHAHFEVQLTPTSIYMFSSESYKYNYTCKLINNQMDTVSLECFKYNYKNEKEETQVFTYTLKPCTKENLCLDEGGWLVYQKIKPYKYFDETLTYIIPSKSEDAPKDKFVNPLFYKKLSPVSRGSRPTFLTPTSLTYLDLYDKEVVEKCKMLENTPMFVTLECSYYNDFLKRMKNYIVRYVLQGCDDKTRYCYGGAWRVLENESGSAIGTFVIDKKDMGQ